MVKNLQKNIRKLMLPLNRTFQKQVCTWAIKRIIQKRFLQVVSGRFKKIVSSLLQFLTNIKQAPEKYHRTDAAVFKQ